MWCFDGIMHALQKLLFFHVFACLGQAGHGSDIIKGKKAPENSFLYMASVQSDTNHVCGGFLITADFVLTAAHCTTDKPTHVVLGTHNLKNSHQEKITIEKKFKPKFYQRAWHGDDIMLLKLSRKVQLNNRVKIIPLPSAKVHLRENEVCQVSGWGKARTDGKTVNELRVVDVPVVNKTVCKELWHGLPANVICAGGYGTDKGFCQGDSGGPLVCKGIAVGIVSFNNNNSCDYPDVPNVFTDISKYRPWINSILKNPNSDNENP
ncbi:mast cell protease 4-like [Oreochromis aureus]|uniref:Peptidase S1 domain-containing protein n=1 Tax=Oreochromis aureus TaxID=47969 RepID=A0A668SR81_OREAU|nr:mast cell protease 4-like [Oreochromis aureus]